MAKVVIDLSMSLDGFITGPNPTAEQALGLNGEPLHAWFFNGPTPSLAQWRAARARSGTT